MVALTAAALVAACDGGRQSGNESETETPSDDPTASPSPSPTYESLPLRGTTSFDTINAGWSFTGDPDTGPVSLGVVSTEQRSARVRVTADTSTSNGTFGASEDRTADTFSKPELVATPSISQETFGFRRTSRMVLGQFSQLDLLNNSLAGVKTANPTLQLDHASYASWWRGDSAVRSKRYTAMIWGYPTMSADLPVRGELTYPASAAGRAVSITRSSTTIRRVSGPVTMKADRALGRITLELNLSSVTDTGLATRLGMFKAEGRYAPGQTQFTGNFSGETGLNGTIAGGFFGPAGKEVCVVFVLTGALAGNEYRIAGVVVGRSR